MHIEARGGTVILRKLGREFAVRDAERMAELLRSLPPISYLVLDFTGVRKYELMAFLPLVRLLRALVGVTVVLRGPARHQERLLGYLGLKGTLGHARA